MDTICGQQRPRNKDCEDRILTSSFLFNESYLGTLCTANLRNTIMRKFRIVGTMKYVEAATFAEALSLAIDIVPNADIMEVC